MINKVYGVENKKQYFPRTYWKIDGKESFNASLIPDTIMINDHVVYVLDAKYYKYGNTLNLKDLPSSTSVNKQITYGEYIAENEEFKEDFGDDFAVYNAFLMPFNAQDEKWFSDKPILRIGEAYGDWKKSGKSYEKIQGIMIDVKFLMKLLSVGHNQQEILKLADKIVHLA